MITKYSLHLDLHRRQFITLDCFKPIKLIIYKTNFGVKNGPVGWNGLIFATPIHPFQSLMILKSGVAKIQLISISLNPLVPEARPLTH